MIETRVYLARHGRSKGNEDGVLTGQLDAPLVEAGVLEAQQTRQALEVVRFEAIFSSDSSRAIDTAEIVGDRPVPEANRLPGLRERDYGELQGRPWHELDASEAIKRTLPEDEQWAYRSVPGMETDQELYDRFMGTLQQVATGNIGKTILVVAHGGPIRVTLMKLKELSHDDLPRGSFKNAGYIELDYNSDQGFKILHVDGVEDQQPVVGSE